MGSKEGFYQYFQHESTALQAQIDRLPDVPAVGGERHDAIEHCLAGIARLSNEVKDASSYIPPYDQRTYSESIKGLSTKLESIRTSLQPRAKFSFKTFTVQKNPSAISLNDAAELASQQRRKIPGWDSNFTVSSESSINPTPLDKTPMTPRTPAEPIPEVEEEVDTMVLDGDSKAGAGSSLLRPEAAISQHQPISAKASSVTIRNHTNAHIILPTSAAHATSSGTISNIKRCVVDLSETSSRHAFAGLTVKNVKDSLIVCGQASGPIHITAIENSIIVVSCRQFRMHEATNTTVYLRCTSRPIIEDCEAIKFAPLPTAYESADSVSSNNQWDQVDDFKWLKAELNPHWHVLPDEQMVRDNIWRDLVPGGPGKGIEEIFKAVSIPT